MVILAQSARLLFLSTSGDRGGSFLLCYYIPGPANGVTEVKLKWGWKPAPPRETIRVELLVANFAFLHLFFLLMYVLRRWPSHVDAASARWPEQYYRLNNPLRIRPLNVTGPAAAAAAAAPNTMHTKSFLSGLHLSPKLSVSHELRLSE